MPGREEEDPWRVIAEAEEPARVTEAKEPARLGPCFVRVRERQRHPECVCV